MQQAELFAKRVQREAGDDVAVQVNRAFRLAFGREASGEERDAGERLVKEHGLTALTRALFNANEFLFVQ